MALPSTTRPKEIEEELEERVKLKQKKEFVLTVPKDTVFLSRLNEWYRYQRKSREQPLTPKELKRHAVRICAEHKIIYDALPPDWVDSFKKENKVKFKVPKKRKKKDEYLKTPSKRSRLSHEEKESSRNILEEDLAVSSSDDSLFEQIIVPKKKKSSGSTTSPESQSERKLSSSPTSASAEIENRTQGSKLLVEAPRGSIVPKGKRKKFLDLTKVPPPPTWLKAYAAGVLLPRMMTIYSTEDTNILYYDYSPRLKDKFGRDVKLGPQPRFDSDVGNVFKLNMEEET